MTKLVVATGNPGKLREMQAYLADSDWELTLKPEVLDIEEIGRHLCCQCLFESRSSRISNGKLGDR